MMRMNECLIFDESSWTYIEQLLPNDEMVKRAVLDDFIWFVNRPVKYKCNRQKIEAYIRHLKLKSDSNYKNIKCQSDVFKAIDLDELKMKLKGEREKS